MPLWNLSSLDELETTVLTAQGVRTPPSRGVTPGQYRSSAIKTAVKVAALAAVSYSVIVLGSSNVLGLPQSVATSAVNVDPARTPLDELFQDRFDLSWTKEIEGSLMAKAAKKAVAPDRDIFNFVQTAQHESLAPDLRRLTEEDVLKFTRRKV